MIRFLHGSDLHIGRTFGRFDDVLSARLFEARFDVLRRLASEALKRDAAFVILAGDTWDNEIPSDRVLRQTLDIFAEASAMRWLLLPGNHDPLGHGALWDRVAQAAPENVTVLRAEKPQDIPGGVTLLPAPCTAAASNTDPTAWMSDAQTPRGNVRIGIAHGSIQRFEAEFEGAIIAPDRAARSGLDYLALGDWHGWVEVNARTIYPGTPEPDRFREGAGHAAFVTLSHPGAEPVIERIDTGKFHWIEATVDHDSDPDPAAALARMLPDGIARSDILLALSLEGTASASDRDSWRRATAGLELSLRWMEVDDSRLGTLVSADDLDMIDRQGALRDAAESLRDAAGDTGLSDADRAAAALALDLLYSWSLEAGDTA